MPEPTPIPTEQLHFAMPPTHDTIEDERRYRKERLVAALRLFGRFGFEEGVAGHITARDPEFTDLLLGQPLRDVLQAHHGQRPDPGQPRGEGRRGPLPRQPGGLRDPLAGPPGPSRTSSPRPTATPSYGRALSSLGELLEPITQDVCAFYESHALYDDYTGVVVDEEEGRRIAAALGPHKAVILRNHGLLTVGDSVDAAAWWFITMERSCQVQLTAKAAGKPVLIDHHNAVHTREQLGNDLVAWINYQPLYQQIARSEPDLFD